MKKIHSFEVVPSLPESLIALRELAYNLRFSWDHKTISLFRRLDSDLLEKTGHNPVLMLGRIDQSVLDFASRDESFLSTLDRVYTGLKDHLKKSRWFQKAHPDFNNSCIAYFSAEFGLNESLKMYSGGLGVLSGDHLKSASELGLPLVAVGLLYQEGYFQQYLNQDGWQQELYPENDFYNMPISAVQSEGNAPLLVDLDLPEGKLYIKVWRCDVGNIPLFLLDTNISQNQSAYRDITDQLYGGDVETRILQEMVLGIGGIRALRAMKIRPEICHLNEGHSAFLVLERIKEAVEENKLTLEQARTFVRSGNVFTTHTPVPAGFDIFDQTLMNKYFAKYVERFGLSFAELMKLGERPSEKSSSKGGSSTKVLKNFNMATFAINHASHINGVSKLHASISRKLFLNHWPNFDPEDMPITHITNGIHTRSWISSEMSGLLDRYLGPRWESEPTNQEVWQKIKRIPDEELWRTHERRKQRLVAFARKRLKSSYQRRGASEAELKKVSEALNADILTICFARRFASYKRATLLLNDMDRLKKLLTNEKSPVQIIFAGKAHPKDKAGKELIKKLVHFSRDPQIGHRFIFIENYDVEVGRYMVQGADIWLNNPRRPYEASGTSGMKVLPNGGLNLSILDGWWDEAYNSNVGWAVGGGEEYKEENEELQNAIEANAIYELLEKEIIPLYYDRGDDGLPRIWLGKIKNSMASLCPVFNTNRMVHEYTERFYLPALRRQKAMQQNNWQATKDLVVWSEQMHKNWEKVAVKDSNMEIKGAVSVGSKIEVTAVVKLDKISNKDVSIKLISGQINSDGQLLRMDSNPMKWVRQTGNGEHLYQGEIATKHSGNFGYTVQILPANKDAVLPNDLNLIAWEEEK